MMEETNALLNKGNAQLLSRLENRGVVLTAAWCCNVLNS